MPPPGDRAPPRRSSLERHRYPRGLPFSERNADNTGRNKNYTLISVSHDPPRANRDDDDDFPSTTSHNKAPRLRSAASRTLRGFLYANGLPDVTGVTPTSDTVTKVVIV